MERTKQVEKTENARRYKIPQDLLFDVLRILFGNQIKHKIEGIKQRENVVILQVGFKNTSNHRQAEDNIEIILNDYSNYAKGLLSDATLFMDEEDEEN